MKKLRFINLFTNVLIASLMSLGFVACGGESKNTDSKHTQKIEEKVYIVGSESAYAPFSFVDRNGIVSGYDVDVLKLLANVDKTLKFDFIPAPWNALFVGLDSGRFDLIANQIISTPERQEKYTLNTESYFVSTSQFVVEESSKIQNINDLSGLKIGAVVGSSHTKILEEWVKKTGNKAQIIYYNDLPNILQDIANHRIDAHLNDPVSMMSVIKTQGLKLRILPERIASENVYFVMKKGEDELARRLDETLKIVKENGELKKLSEKYFGADLTK